MFDAGVTYWITPVAKEGPTPPLEVVRHLVVDQGIFAIRRLTHDKSQLRQGDRICFYANGTGVVADALVTSEPRFERDEKKTDGGEFPFVFHVDEVRSYLDEPVAIDRALRGQLDAFIGKSIGPPWSWFVKRLHTVSESDFNLLTEAAEG